MSSERATPTTTSTTAAASAAAVSPAARSATMPPTCAVQPIPTPRANAERDASAVPARSSGSVSCTTPELKAVPAAIHSCFASGIPLGMSSASPVVVDAGRKDATFSAGRPSAAPAAPSPKSSSGHVTAQSARSAWRCWTRTARCVCAYSPRVTMHGCTATSSAAPAPSR